VSTGPTFLPGAPRRILSLGSGVIGSNIVPMYDLTPDDQRFIMARLASTNQAPGAGQLVVVDNWITELYQKMKRK